MFRRLTEPLPLSAASLLLLRPALNAPVLNVGYLPVGPARAAVVAFGEEYGGIGIALGVRSSEGGQLVVLRNQESIDFDVPLAEALEPLLAEAERMGFLFDEDLFETHPGAAGRAQAMSHWADLMGGMESLIPPREPSEDERRGSEDDGPVGPLSPSLAVDEMQYSELMLDDVAPLVLDGDELGLSDDEDETLESDFDDDFDDVLDDELGGSLGGELRDEIASDRWRVDAPLVGEADLTEPTAPILAAGRAPRPAAGPASPPVPPARTTARAVDSTPPRAPAPNELPAAPSAATRAAPMPSKAVEAPAAVPASSQSAAPAVSAMPIAPKAIALPAAPVASPAPVASVAAEPEGAPVEKTANAVEPARAIVAPVSPRVVLSKFRQVEGKPKGTKAGAEKGEVGADRSSELARIPIVRVRRERDAVKRVPFLARLLSSF